MKNYNGIMELISENILIQLFVFLIFVMYFAYRFAVVKLNKNMRLREMELKELMIERTNNKNEKNVKQALERIPKGVSEDEFFDRLKKELLEVSYIQLKNSNKDEEDNSLYKFLESHHHQALQQSSVQFWFSICAAVVGFVFIIVMICTASGNAWYEYILKVLPGTIIEAVSVLFINQARETRDRAARFFKELNYEKQISKSVSIADSIENEETKATVKAQIALHIIGLNNEDTKDSK